MIAEKGKPAMGIAGGTDGNRAMTGSQFLFSITILPDFTGHFNPRCVIAWLTMRLALFLVNCGDALAGVALRWECYL